MFVSFIFGFREQLKQMIWPPAPNKEINSFVVSYF